MSRILVIEDESSVRENIIELLELEGFQAAGAQDGYEGYFLASTEAFDLVICDIMLPKLDGYSVLERVRQNHQKLRLPFIFLTAHTQREYQRKGMNLGADDFITKPFTRLELLEAIRSQLGNRRQLIESVRKDFDHRQDLMAYQMPLEMTPSLSLIRNLAEKIAFPERNDSPYSNQELARQILAAASFTEDISQKYLYLADLEKRRQHPERQQKSVCLQADQLLVEIMKDRMKSNRALETELVSFDCALAEADYFKFIELITMFALTFADPEHPIRLEARLIPGTSQVSVAYKITKPGILNSDIHIRPMEEFDQLALEREELALSRIATLLGASVQFYLGQKDLAEVVIHLPLADKK
jgi:two-component system, sensor histidine kinase and response regulator